MFFKGLISNRNGKMKVKGNMPVYLELLILEISKTLMNEIWSDYIKTKYQQNTKTMLYRY